MYRHLGLGFTLSMCLNGHAIEEAKKHKIFSIGAANFAICPA